MNQDIDSYKDDFFKGLTMRQTLFAVAAVVVSGGLLAFFLLYLKLNASVAMYLTLPVAFPIIAIGFIKVHGIPLGEYLKRKKKVQQQCSFFYQPEMVYWLNQGLRDYKDTDSDERDATRMESPEKRGKANRKKKFRKFYLETEETIPEAEKRSEKKAESSNTGCSETEFIGTESGVRAIEGNEGIQGADAASVPAAEDGPAADPHQPDFEGRYLSAGGETGRG
ncbi:PrgI family protein [Porcincola intestinalis]|uniref:PrgI family protein n=1 Tax=Porcincola intestinalis TaxID=2606632 RepID=UPI002A90F696|nr:PrgI family protein [Porcincola intestinalis]